MSRAAPFAYGHKGRLLTSTHEDEVFVCGADDEAPLFIHQMNASVAGVRNVEGGVLAVDEDGELRLLGLPDGQPSWRVSSSVSALGLAATDSGRWAVIHDHGAILGQGDAIDGSVDAADVVAGAFGEQGSKLGLVTATGALIVADAKGGAGRRIELGAPANGVAWSSLGWWLASTTQGVYRWAPGDEQAVLYLKWGGDGSPQRVVASADGRLCAFVSEDKHVVVFGVEQDINGGAIVYFDRSAGELEFGPGNSLGVGIGGGDGNKIDLLTGDVCRTDPPPGRERNRWMLQVGLDFADIRRVLGLPPAQPASTAPSPDATPDSVMSRPMKFLVFSSVGLAAYVLLRLLLTLNS